MKQQERSPLGLYTIGIAALFLGGFMLLVVFGAITYQNTVSYQETNNRTRSLLSYFVTSVQSNGKVTVKEGDNGQELVIADGNTGYGMHIYRYEGNLLEEYKEIHADLNPVNANVIGKTDLFQIEKIEEDALRIYTDAGNIIIHIEEGEE